MLNWLCAGRFGLGWAHDAITVAYHMLMHFHAYVLYNRYILYIFELFWDFSECFFLPPYSLVYVSVSWHLSVNLLYPRTLFISRHLLLLLRMPKRTSWRTFLDEAFILNAESLCQTSPTLTYPLSFTIWVGSHCVTSRSHVHPCWSKSFTPTCMDSIIQYLSLLLVFEVHA